MLHVLSTLRESFKVFNGFDLRVRPYGGPILPMDWITVD